MIVVLDSNVLVSAILSPGSPADRLVAAAQDNAIDLVVFPHLVSGDKDLLEAGLSLPVVTPRAAVDRLR